MDLTPIRDRFRQYVTILRPDRSEPDWWAGAPSIANGPDGRMYLAVRMREAVSPRGRRGYEVRILASDDGLAFHTTAQIRREDVPIGGFERPALLYDRRSGLFRLYLCGPWPHEGTEEWRILRLDDVADPALFRADTVRAVLCAPPLAHERDCCVRGYKDPFVWLEDDGYHMLVIGYAPERTYHFASADGDVWKQVGAGPWLDLGGWHTFYTRPACVVPLGVGWLVVYEGSHPTWFDPGYNIATGLAWSPDLRALVDLTPAEPLLMSTTPGQYHTWRYSHWIWRGGELWAYAEVACADGTNEVRLFRLPVG